MMTQITHIKARPVSINLLGELIWYYKNVILCVFIALAKTKLNFTHEINAAK